MKPLMFLAALLLLMPPANADTPPRYRLTVLPLEFYGSNRIDDDAPQCGINAQGQVVGMATVKSGRFEEGRAALWQKGKPLRTLDKDPVKGSTDPSRVDLLYPTAVNARGMATGTAILSYTGAYTVYISTAYLLWNGRIHSLDRGFSPASVQMASAALGLNDDGDIVGGYQYDNTDADQIDNPAPPGTENRHAFLRRKNRVFRLWPGVACGINNHGWIVGVKDLGFTNDGSQGVLWRSGRTTLLKMQPTAINEHREITGNIPISDDIGRACLWRQGKIISLTKQKSHAYALNNRGQVVGEQGHAVLWQDGRTYNLNRCVRLPKSWVLEKALGINDHGWIIGEGSVHKSPRDTQTVKSFAFLLTPR